MNDDEKDPHAIAEAQAAATDHSAEAPAEVTEADAKAELKNVLDDLHGYGER